MRIGQRRAKDTWDKLGAVSGVLVAAIGAIATGVYAWRQRQNERSKTERELRVQQAQTVQLLIPHLQSNNDREKRIALLAVSALGNEDLALRLAELEGSAGSVGAVTAIAARSTTSEGRDAAHDALASIFSALAPSVVQVGIPGAPSSQTGFVARDDGVVLTVDTIGSHDRYAVRFPNGAEEEATLLTQDTPGVVAMRLAATRLPALPIERDETDMGFGGTVVTLGYSGSDAAWRPAVGRLTSRQVRLFAFPQLGDNAIGIEIESAPGFAGAPVLNSEAHVIGLIYASAGPVTDASERRHVFLLSADRLREALEQIPSSAVGGTSAT
jgi:hypothetical protein